MHGSRVRWRRVVWVGGWGGDGIKREGQRKILVEFSRRSVKPRDNMKGGRASKSTILLTKRTS